MKYAEFRAAWDTILQAAGLSPFGWPTETIDLGLMSRGYEALFTAGAAESAGPFSVSAALSWKWDALQSARTMTVEEDLLVELFGRDGALLVTEQPWLRVDVRLNASLPWGQPIALPPAEVWRGWVAGVNAALDPLLPRVETNGEADELPTLAWRGDPQAELECDPEGRLWLQRVKVPAWQAILLPRRWDNPDRPADEGLDDQLTDFARRLREALLAWIDRLDALL